MAPATSSVVARRVPEYLDKACVKVVEGAVPETSALLELAWDHILYTGGGNVGRIVMSAAAKHLTPVTLELGGKNPVIVFDDADLDRALDAVVFMIYSLNGQRCTSSSRLLIQSGMSSRLTVICSSTIFQDTPQGLNWLSKSDLSLTQ